MSVLLRFILRSSITITCLLLVLIFFEFYLRREGSYVVQKNIKDSGSTIEANPELLVQYTSHGRRFVPNAEVTIKRHFLTERDVDIKINSIGFRDDEISPQKDQNELRILALGDSITVADYLDSSETYVKRLQTFLQENLKDKKITVVNAGIGNVGIEEEISILNDNGLTLNPDIVMIGFYLNDSRPPWGFSGEIGDRGWLRRHSILVETIYRNWKEKEWRQEQGTIRFKWIEEQNNLNWKEDRAEFMKLVKLAQYDWGAAWEAPSWDVIERNFAELQALSRKYNFRVLVVAFPVSFQVFASFLEDAPQKNLEKVATKYEFMYLDLLSTLREYKSDEKIFFDHCHPTPLGNNIIAKTIADYLLGQVISNR